jgi:signal transduction histidine kinase
MRDINDMKFFQLVMDPVPNLVFVKDDNDVFLYANQALLNIYAPELRDKLIGTKASDFLPAYETDSFLSGYEVAFKFEQTKTVQELIDWHGKRRIFNTRKMTFLTDDGEIRLVGIADEITDLIHREEELSLANTRLNSFSSMAAHDLRSPLASLIMALEQVKIDKNSLLSEKSKRNIELITSTTMGLLSRIETSLMLVKAEKAYPIKFDECNLNILLEELQFTLKALLTKTNANIISSGLSTISCVPNVIKGLFQNLIENAIKYARPNIKSEISICQSIQDGHLCIHFEDNGQGICKEDRDKIFGEFEQVGNTEGFGLGLSVCSQAMKLHGGTIRVEDGLEGSKFICQFPESILILQELPA